MKTIVSDREDILLRAAEQIKAIVRAKPDAVLALAAGRSLPPLYRILADHVRAGTLSLARVRAFAVTEFDPAPEGLSCRHALEESLLNETDIRPENCLFLSPEGLEAYDEQISLAGGLDLALLGLGDNAHIGFNEPATPFDSLTHRQKLAPATRRQYGALFGGEELVPEFGLTMGVKTLCSAREIILLALGEEKAEAVCHMLYGRTDSAVPAAFLQVPVHVTVYLDREAASKL